MLRSQHAEATRRAVLAAARTLFGGQGYAQTSVDEIAAVARVTKGAIYHHFAGKEALFRAVYTEVLAEAVRRAADAGDPEGPPIDRIVAQVDSYLDAALDGQTRRIALVDGPAVLGLDADNPTDQQQSIHAGLRLFITAAIAHGQMADLDPDLLARLIGGLAWLGGVLIAHARDPATARAELGKSLSAMLRGLAPDTKR